MRKKAILCVDDESIILDSLTEQLEKHFGSNYIYESAENADEGLEIIKELIEDKIEILIIVSDWLMPGMKGDEFLIKVHEKHPGIGKVLLTGQARQESINKAAEEAELYAVLNKPWLKEELIDIINRILIKNETGNNMRG